MQRVDDLLPYQCSKCDYPLAGLPKIGTCPECGHPYDTVRAQGCRLPMSKQEHFDRGLRRLRTVSIGLAAVGMFGLSVALAAAGYRKFIYTGIIFTILLIMWTITSYVYEEEEQA